MVGKHGISYYAGELLRCAVVVTSLYLCTISVTAFRAPCTSSRSKTYYAFS